MTKKNGAIEFWRFLFTVLICFLHFESNYNFTLSIEKDVRIFQSTYLCVEFFFLLSGFLLAQSSFSHFPLSRNSWSDARLSGTRFYICKIRTFIPIYCLSIITYSVYQLIMDPGSITSILALLVEREWDLMGLSQTGMGLQSILPFAIWYFSALCIVGYFVTVVFTLHRGATITFLAPFCSIFFYSYLCASVGSLDTHTQRFTFFSGGIMRAIAGLSLGLLLFMIFQSLKDARFNSKGKAVINVLEIFSLIRLYTILINQPHGINNARSIIYFSIVIVIAFLKVSMLSNILDNKISIYLGKISLSMYIVHTLLLSPFHRFFRTGSVIWDYCVYLAFVIAMSSILTFLSTKLMELFQTHRITLVSK